MTTPSDPGAAPAPGPAPTPDPEARTTPIVSWEAPAEEVGPAPGVKFAPHGGRFLAYLLDALIVIAIVVLMTIVLSLVLIAIDGTNGRANSVTTAIAVLGTFLYGIVVLFVTLAYFPYFWAKNGQTPGMRPFHLYVVRDSDGGKISGAQAFVRLLGMWVSSAVVYLGFVWIFIDARRRGWHDLIAGTVVVEKADVRR
jgi:uncharacterized RDD family membrane protein YckC